MVLGARIERVTSPAAVYEVGCRRIRTVSPSSAVMPLPDEEADPSAPDPAAQKIRSTARRIPAARKPAMIRPLFFLSCGVVSPIPAAFAEASSARGSVPRISETLAWFFPCLLFPAFNPESLPLKPLRNPPGPPPAFFRKRCPPSCVLLLPLSAADKSGRGPVFEPSRSMTSTCLWLAFSFRLTTSMLRGIAAGA